MCAGFRWLGKAMKSKPSEILRQGRSVLDPVLTERGFSFKEGPAGPSSVGPFASGTYVNGNRSLEIHFRFSLGLVTYHFGRTSMDHESYMRAILGKAGANRYPGFSDDPMSAFTNLAYDLESFAGAFLNGDSNEFARCAAIAEKWRKTPGFARLPQE
jgi:hypothetical protein